MPTLSCVPLVGQDEEWRPVVGLEGVYEVSSYGRVRRVLGSRGARAGRILVPRLSEDGYLYLGLHFDGKRLLRRVHRLVIEAYVGPRPPGCEVNHIDGIKLNAHYTNLEYVTRAENTQHAYDIGLKPRGAERRQSRLRDADVIEIRRLYRSGVTRCQALGDQFGVSHQTIRDIVKERKWRHLLAGN